jgi:sulfate adenylyltransferase subunit 2
MDYRLDHLKQLESEAIFVIRETAAQFERPVLLFSGGKDSITLAWLARKAFYPGRIPFPFMHVDTGHNFPETIAFRDRFVEKMDARLIVASVQDSIDQGKAVEEKGPNPSRNGLQSITLLDAIEAHKFDACLGGARRDEEKARAKERFFSHRDDFGQWEPKNQRPELWNLFNGRMQMGEHFRVFPISNWTEMDIWQYILTENIEIPPLYFSHERLCIRRGNTILSHSEFLQLRDDETPEKMRIRFRTMGDITITGAV